MTRSLILVLMPCAGVSPPAPGMSTVAEGIETVAQAEVVRTLRCDKGQGYLYSKPLTSDALVRWLDEHRARG